MGCLDVAVGSHRTTAADGPVVAITVGNRCDAAVRVDMGAIVAEAMTTAGDRQAMRAFDPQHQIRSVTLEARRVGRETIEYRPLRVTSPIAELCLDLARIDADEPSPLPVLACIKVGSPVAPVNLGPPRSPRSSGSASSMPVCVDSRTIVGRIRCRGFGQWGLKNKVALQLSMGLTSHSFSLAGTSLSGTAHLDESVEFRLESDQVSQGGRAGAITGDLQATVALSPGLYAGGAINIGKVMLTNPSKPTYHGDLSIKARGNLYLAGGGVVGAAVPTRWGTLKTELMVGRRLMLVSVETHREDYDSDVYSSASQWIAAPKLVLDRWLNPWMSTGVSVGTNLLNRREMSLGVVVRGHTRAFGGSRTRR